MENMVKYFHNGIMQIVHLYKQYSVHGDESVYNAIIEKSFFVARELELNKDYFKGPVMEIVKALKRFPSPDAIRKFDFDALNDAVGLLGEIKQIDESP